MLGCRVLPVPVMRSIDKDAAEWALAVIRLLLFEHPIGYFGGVDCRTTGQKHFGQAICHGLFRTGGRTRAGPAVRHDPRAVPLLAALLEEQIGYVQTFTAAAVSGDPGLLPALRKYDRADPGVGEAMQSCDPAAVEGHDVAACALLDAIYALLPAVDAAVHASRFEANLTLLLVTADRGLVTWNADALLIRAGGDPRRGKAQSPRPGAITGRGHESSGPGGVRANAQCWKRRRRDTVFDKLGLAHTTGCIRCVLAVLPYREFQDASEPVRRGRRCRPWGRRGRDGGRRCGRSERAVRRSLG